VSALDAVHVGIHLPGDRPSVAGACFRDGRAQVIQDAAADDRVSPVAARYGVHAMAYQPVLLDERPVGVLSVAWPEVREEISQRVLQMLELLAAEAAVALERSAFVARLEDLTRTDPLTQALNRRGLDEELTREIARCRRHALPLSIAMLDLDHFKTLNDSRGHAYGDEVLRDSAVAWRGLLREADTLARHGGEEFVVVLPGCSAADAAPLVDRLRAATACGQTVSAGVATWTPGETPDELIRRADAALYRAKDAGRDRTVAA
jgi:diguanylate cyclase (GGDEF)-like protein